MATYKQIQEYVKMKYGFVPKTCWIAHAKEIMGFKVRKAWNRKGERKHPCPPGKLEFIQKAFRHFEMI